VKTENLMDIAGDYAITDAGTSEKIAVLKKDFTFLIHSWTIQDADGNELALIQSRGKFIGLLRAFTDVANFLPHKYSIENAEGESIGDIKREVQLERYL
jgi:hypothetical protein